MGFIAEVNLFDTQSPTLYYFVVGIVVGSSVQTTSRSVVYRKLR
jgi:hypothetical protein